MTPSKDFLKRVHEGNKDKLCLFPEGDNYRFYEYDAKFVSKLLGLILNSDNGLSFVQFPKSQLDYYANKLNGQKYVIVKEKTP